LAPVRSSTLSNTGDAYAFGTTLHNNRCSAITWVMHISTFQVFQYSRKVLWNFIFFGMEKLLLTNQTTSKQKTWFLSWVGKNNAAMHYVWYGQRK
jgi:hypothetical protein